MENAYHALLMAGAILLFIIAVTIGVYTYSTILRTNGQILTVSEKYDRALENFDMSMYSDDTKRQYTGAEIIMQIVNMSEGKDYSYTRITVDGKVFQATKDAEGNYKLDLNSALSNIASIKTSSNVVYFIDSISIGNDTADVTYRATEL
jgi:hypothetical protein